jgi:hypothetical protein
MVGVGGLGKIFSFVKCLFNRGMVGRLICRGGKGRGDRLVGR